MNRRRERGERGVVAVIVAICALTLFSTAALTVDIGQAVVQKRDIQKRTDFAALAGAAGNDLPQTAGGIACSNTTPGEFSGTAAKATDQAVIDAANYLNTQLGAGTITPAQLTDCMLGNGEAMYGILDASNTLVPNANQLTVVSQPDLVNFGFAQVMGFNNANVRGIATAEIKTPLINTLPLYAATGCDYGTQTISQPTNGHSSSGVNLSHSTGNEGKNTNITFDTSQTTVTPSSNTSPPTVAYNVSGSTVTLHGTNLDKVTSVGFFESAPSNPPEPIQVAVPSAGVTVSPTVLTVRIPDAVVAVQDTWFVRLYGDSGGPHPDWTPVLDSHNANQNTNLLAQAITVGSATLTCAQGSSSGNFGSLLLPNTSAGAPNGQDDNIAFNIAVGLQHSLAPYPTAQLTPPDYTCATGQAGAVLWAADGTNCVDTKTGLTSAAAQEGFVDGVAGHHGLLATTAASSKCPFDYPTGTTHLTVAPTGPTINNDVLSCYFTNDTVTVGDVSSSGYTGGPVIDQSIYDSPRFVQVPVLGVIPANGGSNKYEIVDFRPAFITDESAGSNRSAGPTTGNGLTWSGNKLQSVQVTFLNLNALPNPPVGENGKYIPYVGAGKKIPLLVN